MPLDRPSAEEFEALLALPATQVACAESAFLSRVASNVLAIIARERKEVIPGVTAKDRLEQREVELWQAVLKRSESVATLHGVLCEEIRAGHLDWTHPAVMDALHEVVEARLAIDNPRYKR